VGKRLTKEGGKGGGEKEGEVRYSEKLVERGTRGGEQEKRKKRRGEGGGRTATVILPFSRRALGSRIRLVRKRNSP